MNNAYDRVTASIIAALETGTAPWVKPWSVSLANGEKAIPYNMVSQRAYRGINTIILGMAPYASNGWATFKQIRENNGSVRKGEHGSMIVYYDRREVEADDGETKVIPMLKTFIVFNREQCDWKDVPTEPVVPAEVVVQPYEQQCMATLEACNPKLSHGGDSAFYRPATDSINMPARKSFKSGDHYWATLLHELTHWTSHPSRLDRDLSQGRYGNPEYAFEELVAELGAAFLCAAHGVDGDLRHAGYIASWLKALNDDKRAIFKASALAQKAADFIIAGAVKAEQQIAA